MTNPFFAAAISLARNPGVELAYDSGRARPGIKETGTLAKQSGAIA